MNAQSIHEKKIRQIQIGGILQGARPVLPETGKVMSKVMTKQSSQTGGDGGDLSTKCTWGSLGDLESRENW